MQAKAVVFPDREEVEVQTVDCPDPGPDNLVVRVTHSWISNGTEGSFLRGERIAGDTAYRPGDSWPFPIVAGYQKIGVVEWVGEGITDIAVGEPVFCAMGRVNGMFQQWGGHVSPSVTVRNQVWKLPPDADPLAFAGLVLTQVGYNCGTRGALQIGDPAIVIGDGMVGQWAAQTLAWRGARVALVGRHEDRLEKFAVPGPHHRVNAADLDWQKAVRELFPDGVTVAVDTVGDAEAVRECLPLLIRNGHIVSAGFYGTDDLLSMQDLRMKETSFHSVSGWTLPRMNDTRHLIASGNLHTLPLITHHFPVDQAAEAWEVIRGRRDGVLGVILEWEV